MILKPRREKILFSKALIASINQRRRRHNGLRRWLAVHLFLLAPLNNATHKKKKWWSKKDFSLSFSKRSTTFYLVIISYNMCFDCWLFNSATYSFEDCWNLDLYSYSIHCFFFSFLDHCIIELQAKLFLYCLGSFRITALWRLKTQKFIMPIPNLKLSQSALRIALWDPIFGPSELDVSKVRLITFSLISKSDGQVGFWFGTR